MRAPAQFVRGFAVMVCAASLALVACASGEGSATAHRSARRWADTVCSALGRWIDTAATGEPPAAAEAALRLRAEIARARPPKTDDGLAAQGEVERLATAIEQQVRTGNRARIGEIAAEARTALDGIRGLTPGGAVEGALDHAARCRALRG